jgi:Tfp pilus assembly protein PilF
LAADEPQFTPQKTVALSTRKPQKVDEANLRDDQASDSKQPLKLVSKTPVAGVDPTLLAAYEAFNRGDDTSAQQKYCQVLQKDVRNIDALLGMAAIAQRQDRNMDAIGWYRKVTEIEPRNSIAQSAMADLEVSVDGVAAESKIKSMLARQPDAANLHAALGNLYAAQNQWASAQSAYFNASQYAPISADYAFNLAISLEHLGKPKLALVQYQRALELLNITGAGSPDRAQLEARVRALQ